jgi:hypothetical protein
MLFLKVRGDQECQLPCLTGASQGIGRATAIRLRTILYLPVAFLSKDFLFLAASFYLLKQDFARVAMEIEPIRFGT